MKIRLWSIEEMFDETVHLIDKDKDNLYHCNKLCYQWIHYIKKEKNIKGISLEKAKKEKYMYVLDKNDKDEEKEKWFYAYEISNKNIYYLNQIALFFYTFLCLKEKSPAFILEIAIEKTKDKIPNEILKEMLTFTLKYYEKHPDRIRLLYKIKSMDCF